MGQIKRTYPEPDTDRPNCGPRERAMAVFKKLLDMEPEDAVGHEHFAVVEHAFVQENVRGQQQMAEEWADLCDGELPPVTPVMCSPFARAEREESRECSLPLPTTLDQDDKP